MELGWPSVIFTTSVVQIYDIRLFEFHLFEEVLVLTLVWSKAGFIQLGDYEIVNVLVLCVHIDFDLRWFGRVLI